MSGSCFCKGPLSGPLVSGQLFKMTDKHQPDFNYWLMC